MKSKTLWKLLVLLAVLVLAVSVTTAASAFLGDLSEARVTFSSGFGDGVHYYDGTPIEPVFSVWMGDEYLFKGDDYTATLENNVEPGKAVLRIQATETGRVSGSKDVPFEIRKLNGDLSDTSNQVILMDEGWNTMTEFKWSGKPILPKVMVEFDGRVTAFGNEYETKYGKNTDPGEGTVTLIGTGKEVWPGVPVTGERVIKFKIVKEGGPSCDHPEGWRQYEKIDNETHTIKCELCGESLGTESHAIKEGIAMISSEAPYGGRRLSCSKNCGYFETIPKVPELSSGDVADILDQEYTGRELKPGVTVTTEVQDENGGVTSVKVKDEHISIEYKNNVGPGKGVVEITGDGKNVKGKVVKEFVITQPAVCAHEKTTKKWDANNHWDECDKCHEKLNEQAHTMVWNSDDEEHWKVCTADGCDFIDETSKGPHTDEWQYNEKRHWKKCSVCGAEDSIKLSHALVLESKEGDVLRFKCECGYTEQRTLVNLNEATVSGLEEGKEYTKDDLDQLGLVYEGKTLKPGEDYTVEKTEETEDAWIRVFKGVEDKGFKGEKEVIVIKSASVCKHEKTTKKWDTSNHWDECDKCHQKLNEQAHTLVWKSNESEHWKACTTEGCGYIDETTRAPHWANWNMTEEEHWKHCYECQTELTEHEPHKWEYNWDDSRHWKYCAYCNDADLSYNGPHTLEWKSNEKEHWKACTVEGCGYIDETTRAPHWANWNMTEEEHWKHCYECQTELTEHEPHKWEYNWDDSRHWKYCAYCNDADLSYGGPHTLVLDHKDGDVLHFKCSTEGCGYTTTKQAKSLDKAQVSNLEQGKEYSRDELDGLELKYEGETLKKGEDYTVEKIEDTGDLWHIIFKGLEDKGVIGEKEIAVPKCAHNETAAKWDASNHWDECDRCHKKLNMQPHSMEWTGNDTEHFKACTAKSCGYIDEASIGPHAIDYKSSAMEHWQYCYICQTDLSVREYHSWDIVLDNDDHWRFCSVCAYEDLASKAPHTLEWRMDENNHWEECTFCGAILNETAHTLVYEPVTDTAHWLVCSDSRCGYADFNSEEKCASSKWESDSDEHWAYCDHCGQEINTGAHDTKGWSANEKEHWKVCSVCQREEPGTRGEHSLEMGWSAINHFNVCKVCGFTTDVALHVMHLDYDTQQHWYYCLTKGCDWESVHVNHDTNSFSHYDDTFHYFKCSVCGVNVYTAGGQARQPHRFEYEYDETNHWSKCTLCKYTRPSEPHEWKLAGVRNNGAAIQCAVCGASKTLELKDIGDVEIDVRGTGDTLKVKATLSASALAGLITPEDEKAMENGATLYVYMTAAALDASEMPEEALAAVNTALQDTGFEAGLYVDLSFFKQLDENEPTQVHELAGDGVNIEMEVPEEMQAAPEGVERTFQIWTVHNGEAILLSEGTDSTQRFTVNGFSNFVIAYKDAK